MNRTIKSVVSIVAGVLAFAVVGIGVTEALAPYLWPSAMLGLPAGLVAGAVALPLAYLGLTYWNERQETGRASARTRRRLRTLVGATAGFVGGGGLAMAMIVAGFPVGLLSAAVVGYLAFRRSPDESPPGSIPQ